jgi:uncharacterized protein (TIGR02284 family)
MAAFWREMGRYGTTEWVGNVVLFGISGAVRRLRWVGRDDERRTMSQYDNTSRAGASPSDASDASSSATPGQGIEQLNSLLRGEISAAETYRMAIDKVADGDKAANAGLLREIQEEHGRAAQGIRDRIRELGGEASDSSGAWGVWAKTVQGTMNLFGDSSSLKALKEGEEHGLKDYQEALDDVDATSAQLIQNQLIPAQQRHINLLDQLINSVGTA